MIVQLIFTLAVAILLLYVCCYSPPARHIGDVIFYDPLEESIARHEAKMAKRDDE